MKLNRSQDYSYQCFIDDIREKENLVANLDRSLMFSFHWKSYIQLHNNR